jgi:GT2 family glycosyltransferase
MGESRRSVLLSETATGIVSAPTFPVPPQELRDSAVQPEGILSGARPSPATALETMLAAPFHRPVASGKMLAVAAQTLWVRGVTYGTFQPDPAGNEFHDRARVQRDMDLMSAYGFNAVRTYTVPPRWFLDAAAEHGIHVMVGVPWEHHVAFLDTPGLASDIERRVSAGVRACAGHPAVLCYAVGSEIPASVVRWHGRRRVERFLERLYQSAKAEDPGALVTYVNYPTTEYLELPFFDLESFNVYLESPSELDAYLARLQNKADDRPLLLAEVGLDSRSHGMAAQANALDWQIRCAFAAGCVGAFVFAWTDEWHRGGQDITDWDFGLTDRNGRPKPALQAASSAFADAPFPQDTRWPRISVVVCSYNGGRTIGECLDGLQRLDYPNFEIIVVSDGSTDRTVQIAKARGVRVIEMENGGLSSARNTGLHAADGEIVVFIDDDAFPDPNWLTFLAATFLTTDFAAVGGPNLPVPTDGPIAQCVANAPGGPAHVLLSDREAEHIPGCNMAIRKSALMAIGGFDSQYRVAGDDVDVCWRLQSAGGKLGFNAAAVVWHHRRGSVRAFCRQQFHYGAAEALLERKWPEKYNGAGHALWQGRLYGGLSWGAGFWGGRIYHGVWGSASYQSMYTPRGPIWSLLLMPEWYLLIASLVTLSLVGVLWQPVLWALLPAAAAAIATIALSTQAAGAARFPNVSGQRSAFSLRALTAVLILIQPAARLSGRLWCGLSPWRRFTASAMTVPWPRNIAVWSERWLTAESWLSSVEQTLRKSSATVRRGGGFDRWDLEVRTGMLAAARLRMAIEEHGAGRQMVRFRIWPTVASIPLSLGILLASMAALALSNDAIGASAIFASATLFVCWSVARGCGVAMARLMRAVPAGAVKGREG